MGGKRGQAFLREALAVLDAMPEKRLIRDELEGAETGMPFALHHDVCLLGAVGRSRGIDMAKLDPDDMETVAPTFGIADAMAREIVYWNDEGATRRETPEQRWTRMRAWISRQIKPTAHRNDDRTNG